MKRLLARLTATPLLGVLTGLAVTAVLQSSSAATVMVIGFVSAGLLELPRAVAVIYGINIGTTMTAQLIAFDVQTLVYPVLFLGFLLDFAARRPRWQAVGEAVFSFGLLFEGIDILGRALQPLAGQAVFLDWMTRVKEQIQALVCHSFFNNPRRTANGTDYNKVNLLMAVLEKRANLSLSDCDAYVNIAGGIRMNEPAIDLGIVLAIASSKKDIIVREDTICFGEVGLSGEVRGVTMSEQRVAEAKKLGFKKCIVPKVCLAGVSHISGIEIVGVANIKEAIEAVR